MKRDIFLIVNTTFLGFGHQNNVCDQNGTLDLGVYL